VALPGLFWPHYYLLPLPGVAVVVAVHFAEAASRIRHTGVRGIPWAIWVAILAVALGWTVRIQVRDYLMVAPEELTIRYKGGLQWVRLRAIGRELAKTETLWNAPKLYNWGIQSPLYFYSGLDGVSRHFFVDNFLKAYAERDHPLIRPRIEEILRDLDAHPPALIFVGYPPFPALKRWLNDRYYPSSQLGGLWVRRDKYGQFEAFDPVGWSRVRSVLRRGSP
jgi:hypothetical protein